MFKTFYLDIWEAEFLYMRQEKYCVKRALCETQKVKTVWRRKRFEIGLKVKQQLFQHRAWLSLSCYVEGEQLNLHFSKMCKKWHVFILTVRWKEVCIRIWHVRYSLRIWCWSDYFPLLVSTCFSLSATLFHTSLLPNRHISWFQSVSNAKIICSHYYVHQNGQWNSPSKTSKILFMKENLIYECSPPET